MLQPHEIIWSTSTAAVTARCLQVVADLSVADYVGDEPVRVDEVARRCGADPAALARVLTLLSAHGIFERHDDSIGHTDASRLLRSDDARSMRAFPRMFGSPSFLRSFEHLDHSVRTGQPAIEQLDPRGLWAYLQDHPAEADVFGQAMAAKAGADIAAVLATYDFGRFGTIADIGGGQGHLLAAILADQPGARGVLFDLPPVAASVEATDRLTVQPGDFFRDPLPKADAYLLMEVIHDWDDPEAVAILGAIRRAAPAGATVLIIEGVVPDGPPDPRVHTLDVVMLAMTGGRERSADELGQLLHRAGFERRNVQPTPGAMHIVEAVAA
jgi:hypothetical protein